MLLKRMLAVRVYCMSRSMKWSCHFSHRRATVRWKFFISDLIKNTRYVTSHHFAALRILSHKWLNFKRVKHFAITKNYLIIKHEIFHQNIGIYFCLFVVWVRVNLQWFNVMGQTLKIETQDKLARHNDDELAGELVVAII